MAQAKGSNAQLLIYKEDTYATTPAGAATGAIKLPINEGFGLATDRSLITPKTIRTGRNPVMPAHGNVSLTGGGDIPIDLRNFGYWLQAVIGAGTHTQDTAKSINNGEAAVNVGGGVVGIPCTAHGFQAGETVTIANTVNYNGDEVVLSTSTTNQVNITATYNAETFGADDTIRAKRYTHVFKVGTSLYSYVMDQGYTDISVYELFNGVKAASLGMTCGGDQELVANIQLVGAKETVGGTALDSSPTELSFTRFNNFHGAITEGGSSIATVQELEISISNNLDTSCHVIGDGGILGSLPEGTIGVTGRLKAMFESTTLYNKAVNGTESAIVLTFTNGVYSLAFNMGELNYQRKSPGIPTAGGIWIDLPFSAYYDDDSDASTIMCTLVNDYATYAWS